MKILLDDDIVSPVLREHSIIHRDERLDPDNSNVVQIDQLQYELRALISYPGFG